MSKEKKPVGRPKIERNCEMVRVLIPKPIRNQVKVMVKEYDRQEKLKQDEKNIF